MKKLIVRTLAIASVAAAAACTTYTEVTDVTSQRKFFTDNFTVNKETGAAEFTDGKTGAQVRLQSYETKEITPEAYVKGTEKEKK
ncbi:MAG: hypothetical protein U0575_15585 [Phycisphaerales bacterium]